MYFPPAAAHIPTQIRMASPTSAQANVTVSTGPAPTKSAGEGGGLFGTPPPIFNGDRTKAQTFLDAFAIWQLVNYKKDVIRDPYMRTALVLTFIKGDNVNNWAKHQLNLLNRKQAMNPSGPS